MDTRQRIIDATSALFVQRGYAASGLKQIAHASSAPIGSLYHFFPGGKSELAAETLSASGHVYQHLVEAVWDAESDVVASVRSCFRGAADLLRASDFADACPIATVALEVASSDETLRRVSSTIFDSWLASAEVRFVAAGISPREAGELATMFVAALEGGFLLSRTAKDATRMETLGELMVTLVETALAR